MWTGVNLQCSKERPCLFGLVSLNLVWLKWNLNNQSFSVHLLCMSSPPTVTVATCAWDGQCWTPTGDSGLVLLDAGSLALNHQCWPGWIPLRHSHAANVCEEGEKNSERESSLNAVKTSENKCVQVFFCFPVPWHFRDKTCMTETMRGPL